MKTSGLNTFSVLLGIFFLFPDAALGQSLTLTADCTQDTRCLTLKEQASEHSKSGNLVAALRLYRLAYEVWPDPRLLFNIARLLHKQGKPSEAVPYYQKFIAAPIHDEEQQRKASEYLKQIQANPNAETLLVDARLAKKPVYKKWWFWMIIGGVTVSAATGLAISLSSLPQAPTPPAGYEVYTRTF